MTTQSLPPIQNNPAHLRTVENNLQHAFTYLLEKGTTVLTEVDPADLDALIPSPAQQEANPYAQQYSAAIARLYSAVMERNIQPGQLFNVSLRLSGKHSSGFPYFSIQWLSLLNEPTNNGPEKSDEPSPYLTPATEPKFKTPSIQATVKLTNAYNRHTVRRTLNEFTPALQQRILIDLLVDNLVDTAAQSADNPTECAQQLKADFEKLIQTLELKLGLA